jgi:hypothetical protein
MAQAKTHNLSHIIAELTDTENTELVRIFQNPLVIKYFKNVGYTAILTQAMISIDDLVTADDKYRIHQAFQKGVLSVVDTILSNTPIAPINPS